MSRRRGPHCVTWRGGITISASSLGAPVTARCRRKIVRELADRFLKALGYPASDQIEYVDVEDELTIPVYLEVSKASGSPLLWVLISVDAADDGDIFQDDAASVLGMMPTFGDDATVEDLASEGLVWPLRAASLDHPNRHEADRSCRPK